MTRVSLRRTMTQKPKRGRPVDACKRDKILQTASTLFMEQGFDCTHMDHIAKEAGVSKLTLYSRFPDKHSLFIEVMMAKARCYVPDELFDVFDNQHPRQAIITVATALYDLILSEDAIALYRTMICAAQDNPKLTNQFYDHGPCRLRDLLSDKLRHLNDCGILVIPDAALATDFFIALFKGTDIYTKRLLNIGKKPTKKEIKNHIEQIADFFLRAYAG